jgi:hypothetical protein
LLNDPVIRRQAGLFAERVARDAGDDREARVRLVYTIALSRAPDAGEMKQLLAFLTRAEQTPAPGQGDPSLRALTELCHAVFLLNEFVTID